MRACTMKNSAALTHSNWRTPLAVLICGGIILSLSLGTRHTFGLYLQPMTLDLNWSRETFAIAIAIQDELDRVVAQAADAVVEQDHAAVDPTWWGGEVAFERSIHRRIQCGTLT